MLGFRPFSISEHTAYRFGFNGMEKDDEVKGNGNSLDFGARIQDPRIGRWLSLDPLQHKYPSQAPYSFVANSPMFLVEVDGRWYVKFDNPSDPKTLVFVAEDGDNLSTLEIQLGVSKGSLSNNKVLSGMSINTGTELSTELNVVKAVQRINAYLQSENIDLTNCANCMMAANGVKQKNAWAAGEDNSADVMEHTAKRLDADFESVPEKDASVGDGLTFRMSKSWIAGDPDVRKMAQFKGIDVNKDNPDYQTHVEDAFNRSDIGHYGVVLLKSRDGLSISQYLEKPGQGNVRISSYPPVGGDMWTPSPANLNSDESPVQKKTGG